MRAQPIGAAGRRPRSVAAYAAGVSSVYGWVASSSYGVAFIVLLAAVVLRAHATYWLGRLGANGALRTRWGARADARALVHARRWLERWGAPAVSASFLTVGVQTAVNLTAGVVRMGYLRYTVAMAAGGLAWAAIWAGVLTSLIAAAQQRSLTALVAAAAVVAALVLLVVSRRRRARAVSDGAASVPGSGDAGSPTATGGGR